MKINLGGGYIDIPGYLKLDKQPEWGGVRANVIADLEEGLPFPDRSIDVLNASHIFEHIRNFIPLMNECWRVLKDDGFMMVTVPAFPSDGAIAPPDHVRYFVQKTFHCLEKEFCPPDRKAWAVEVNVQFISPLFAEADTEAIFALMRPVR